jgi:hypothetical protein
MVVSQLPSRADRPAHAEQVEATHAPNYYRLNLDEQMFSCPALPYNISFPSMFGEHVPSQFRDLEALEAIGDLVSTAEVALPLGGRSDRWSKAMLGARYQIGKDQTPTSIIVELRGGREGYHVSRAFKATDAEYEEFEQRLVKWQEELRSYYDVYAP